MGKSDGATGESTVEEESGEHGYVKTASFAGIVSRTRGVVALRRVVSERTPASVSVFSSAEE